MNRLPGLRGAEIVRVLERAGFEAARQRGSHVTMKHPDGRQTVVPVHNEEIGPGLMRKILRDVDISREVFVRLLRD